MLCLLVGGYALYAQNYTATNGSSYIGSLNVHNNPSAIVNSPLKWDLTLFGIQDKHSTNAVVIRDYSLLSKPDSVYLGIREGQFTRKAGVNLNINLLNARIALNRRSAIAFGVNFRSYTNVKTSDYNFIDTLHQFSDFLAMNRGSGILTANVVTSSWAEIYASYGRTILDNDAGRLNAGVTVRVNRGLSGGFGNLAGGRFSSTGTNNYTVTGAGMSVGYSSNYDQWDSTKNFGQNIGPFVKNTEGGGSVDVGLEYIVRLPHIDNTRDGDEIYFDYDWKFGVALLDLGFSQYRFGKHSLSLQNIKSGITGDQLNQKFDDGFDDIEDLKDSVSSLFANVGTYTGKYRLSHPARLVLNADKYIFDAFYVNADLSVSLNSLTPDKDLTVKDINLLTVTPRWETRTKGFYLPIYFNNLNQLWVGGAVRYGPLLFGLHNLGNLVVKNKTQRGGFYLSFIVKARNYTGKKGDKRWGCPPVN